VTELVAEELPFRVVVVPSQMVTLLPAFGAEGSGLTINTVALVPVAVAVVTVIFPVVAEEGNVVVIEVSETKV
jgi:hypothetical protein